MKDKSNANSELEAHHIYIGPDWVLMILCLCVLEEHDGVIS